MLVLTRKAGESILIGSDVRIRILSSAGAQTRIAIEAPDDVPILREELYEKIAQANREAARAAGGGEAARAAGGSEAAPAAGVTDAPGAPEPPVRSDDLEA